MRHRPPPSRGGSPPDPAATGRDSWLHVSVEIRSGRELVQPLRSPEEDLVISGRWIGRDDLGLLAKLPEASLYAEAELFAPRLGRRWGCRLHGFSFFVIEGGKGSRRC